MHFGFSSEVMSKPLGLFRQNPDNIFSELLPDFQERPTSSHNFLELFIVLGTEYGALRKFSKLPEG